MVDLYHYRVSVRRSKGSMVYGEEFSLAAMTLWPRSKPAETLVTQRTFVQTHRVRPEVRTERNRSWPGVQRRAAGPARERRISNATV